jgi:two-component system phosphate regulon response regulator PhoB
MEKTTLQKILVVDDEEDILELVKFNLLKEGFSVITALTGEEAIKAVLREHPDLIILDIMLPGLNGYEICRLIKANPDTAAIPIVMLTAKDAEGDELRGWEMGADDYITKPFSNKILLARVKNILKKKSLPAPKEKGFEFEELVILPDSREVIVKGEKVDLTETEFRILMLFAEQPGIVFTRAQIVDSVRGEDYPVTDRSVDVHIVSLRKKLAQCSKMIRTMRGVGYKLDA